jgi:SAM-dependent methyltransferase
MTPEPGPDDPPRRLGQDVQRLGLSLEYAVDPERLGPELARRFMPTTLDTEGEAFLVNALSRSPRAATLRLHRLLTLFLSDFDANALLGTYPVFLLSTPQALALLQAAYPALPGDARLLDVGAGSGDVTTRLSPLVDRITCAERSRGMCRVLRRRGFDTWRGSCAEGMPGDPLASAESHDIVSLLNVIDRCRAPRTLLRAAVEHLPPGGALLLSTPLPFRPFYYSGSITRAPGEPLAVRSEIWEEAARELWESELRPLDLALSAFSRMPYLSRGDADSAAYVLDAAVFACRKTPLTDG